MAYAQRRICPGKRDAQTPPFEIQMDYLIKASYGQQEQDNLPNYGLCYLKLKKKTDKYLNLARELKNIVEHESASDSSCNEGSCYSHQTINSKTGSNVWTIGRVRNCLDAHLGQIVCDKDGVGLVHCPGGNPTDPI